MVIVYESKTGFTKKYADMLSGMTSLKSYPTEDLSKIGPQEEIIFLGWMSWERSRDFQKQEHVESSQCAARAQDARQSPIWIQ